MKNDISLKVVLCLSLLLIPTLATADTVSLSEGDEVLECPDPILEKGTLCSPQIIHDGGETVVICPASCENDLNYPKVLNAETCETDPADLKDGCNPGVGVWHCVGTEAKCEPSEPTCLPCSLDSNYDKIGTVEDYTDPNKIGCNGGKKIWICNIETDKVEEKIIVEPTCPDCWSDPNYSKIGTTEPYQEEAGCTDGEKTYKCNTSTGEVELVITKESTCPLNSCDQLDVDTWLNAKIRSYEKDSNVDKTVYSTSVKDADGKTAQVKYVTTAWNVSDERKIMCIKNPNVSTYGTDGVADFTFYLDDTTGQGVGNLYTYFWGKTVANTASGIVNNSQVFVQKDQKEQTVAMKTTISNMQQGYKNNKSCYVCSYVRYTGCFSPETELVLADGTLKQAKQVAVGDKLFNPVTRSAITVKRVVEGPESIGMVSIKTVNGELRVTQDHPMLTANGLVQAKDVKAGDTLFNGDNEEITVESAEIIPVEDGQWVVNFLLEGADMSKSENRMLLAGGIISGDLQTQIELKNK